MKKEMPAWIGFAKAELEWSGAGLPLSRAILYWWQMGDWGLVTKLRGAGRGWGVVTILPHVRSKHKHKRTFLFLALVTRGLYVRLCLCLRRTCKPAFSLPSQIRCDTRVWDRQLRRLDECKFKRCSLSVLFSDTCRILILTPLGHYNVFVTAVHLGVMKCNRKNRGHNPWKAKFWSISTV